MKPNSIRHALGCARPPGRCARGRMAVAGMMLAWWCTAVTTPHLGARAEAADRPGGTGDIRDGRLVWHRRWWLDVYTHTMQEECFIAWMDVRYRHVEWKLGLPVRQVESLYRWWVPNVWEPAGKGGDKDG